MPKSGAQREPLRAIEHERNSVQLPRTVGTFRHAKNVEGDFLLSDALSHQPSKLFEVLWAATLEKVREWLLVRPHRARLVAELVEGSGAP